MKKRLFFLLLFALSGLVIAVFLAHHHFVLTFGGEAIFPFCRKGCDTVNTSSYSEFLGIPIASFGAVTYAVIGILALMGLLFSGRTLRSFVLSTIFLISIFCVASSLLLAGISLFKLSSFCNLCGLTYLINFLLLVVSISSLKGAPNGVLKTVGMAYGSLLKRQDPKQNMEDYTQRMAVLLAAFVFSWTVVSGTAVAYFHSARYRVLDAERKEKFLDGFAKMQRLAVQTQGAPAKGSAYPVVTLAVFSDFTCSHCRNAAHLIDRMLPEYRKELRLVYKHQVHDSSCNPHKQNPSPQGGCQIAKAAVCAHREGKFWEYHDLLFGTSPPPKVGDLVPYAQQVGIPSERFRQCLNDPTAEDELRRDFEEANRLGAQSTPTFFLNGKMIQGLPPATLLHLLIQKEIAESSKR